MARSFKVDIVTPGAFAGSGEAELITAGTTEGGIGVLADHQPTMAALSTGAVKVVHENGVTIAGIHGGFLQIYRNQVTLLTDRAELTEGSVEDARRAAAGLRDPGDAE